MKKPYQLVISTLVAVISTFVIKDISPMTGAIIFCLSGAYSIYLILTMITKPKD